MLRNAAASVAVAKESARSASSNTHCNGTATDGSASSRNGVKNGRKTNQPPGPVEELKLDNAARNPISNTTNMGRAKFCAAALSRARAPSATVIDP